MANTYTQLYTHIVFSVQARRQDMLIPEEHREETEKYICGIADNLKCKPIAIYCNPDHLHFLLSYPPSVALSDIVREIKVSSGKFINEHHFTAGHFNRQTGF
jgi:REP element-mobilizing transposase RayT